MPGEVFQLYHLWNMDYKSSTRDTINLRHDKQGFQKNSAIDNTENNLESKVKSVK